MDQIKLEELAVAIRIRKIWSRFIKSGGILRICRNFLKFLDSYEPDWNKKRNWEVGRQSFLLDILKKKSGEEMTPEERTDRFNELLTKDMRIFVVVISLPGLIINLYLQEGEDLMLFLAEGTKRLCFPNWVCKAWDEWI